MSADDALARLGGPDARVAIIGGGKMAEAMLAGWLRAQEGLAGQWGPANFTVANPGAARRQHLTCTYGVGCVATGEAVPRADLAVFAVKPQVMPEALAQVRRAPWAAGALMVSIAAGVACESIEAQLLAGTHVVRAMPNTPLLVGRGMTALCAGKHATKEDLDAVADLFGAIGTAVCVRERQMDAVTAISGSGPAYVAALIEAMTAAGRAQGLSAALAEQLAEQTVYGTGQLMHERDQRARRTREDVSSPGGTTLAALAAMEDAGFSASVGRGVEAAVTRAKELGSSC